MTSELSTTASDEDVLTSALAFPDIYAKHGSLVRDKMARLIHVPGTLRGHTFAGFGERAAVRCSFSLI